MKLIKNWIKSNSDKKMMRPRVNLLKAIQSPKAVQMMFLKRIARNNPNPK